MKIILNTIIVLLINFSCYAQLNNGNGNTASTDSNFVPFIGNWEWQDGNETFKVEIYADGNDLKGHYKLVETDTNGNETTIYKSNKLLNPSLNFYYGYAIFGGSNDGILFHALIDDNVLLGNGNDNVKLGNLAFTIINNGTNGQPITATWKVNILQGLKSTEEPAEFSIPTDIVLTKVE